MCRLNLLKGISVSKFTATMLVALLSVTACSSSIELESYTLAKSDEKASTTALPPPENAWHWLQKVADQIAITPDRVGGSEQEQQMADWIANHWSNMGYSVKTLPFAYTARMKEYKSLNLSVDLKGKSDQILLVGAHFDAVGIKTGSEGLIDNGSGVAALLSIADQLRPLVEKGTIPYTIRLVAFGAEERGLQGARNYVNRSDVQREKWLGMINLDTIIGGDQLYVHSAHSSPYPCQGVHNANYNFDTVLREGLLATSKRLFKESGHQLHPATEGYPEGQTGSWSDHAPFACAGIPIAYLEATNFTVKGKRGFDGYSQTDNPEFWTCFDADKRTACDRFREKTWGEIWHTKFDTEKALFPVMKDHLRSQQRKNVAVLVSFLTSPKV